MNITIAGYGFVGQAHESALKEKFNVNIYDPYKGYNTFGDPAGVIVAVSTPALRSGACNIDNVLNVINRADESTPVLIRSTISLEGWQEIKELYPNHKIAFSPEFLRAASAVEDFFNTRRIYVGGDEVGFWHALFRAAFDDPNFITDVATVEELILAKYFRNSFLATKVAFFNQIYDMCEATGINYDVVKHVIAEDARIGNSHTEITAERGFGGHCFPKDTYAIVHTGGLLGVDLSLIKESINYNNRIRNTPNVY
jgi:UDPglucose 6-dehydrogenase